MVGSLLGVGFAVLSALSLAARSLAVLVPVGAVVAYPAYGVLVVALLAFTKVGLAEGISAILGVTIRVIGALFVVQA